MPLNESMQKNLLQIVNSNILKKSSDIQVSTGT